MNAFATASGVQFNAFDEQTVTLTVSNSAIRVIGNTFSVGDGDVFTYTSGGGTNGVTRRFETDVLNDIAGQSTTVNEAFFFEDDTTLNVTSAVGFAVGDFVRTENEVLLITAISGNIFTVKRAQLNTVAQTSLAGDAVVKLDVAETTSVSTTLSATGGLIRVRDAAKLGIDLADGAPHYIRVGTELMRVTAINGNALNVVRGVLGTSAVIQTTNTVVQAIRASQSTTMSETRLDLNNVLQPSTLLQNDRVMTVNASIGFDVRPGDYLQVGEEVLRVISIVDNTATLDLTVDRREFGTTSVRYRWGLLFVSSNAIRT